MGGAQFALPGAVERLRAAPRTARRGERAHALVLAAADPAQPYGAALPWPQARGPASAAPRASPAPMWCSSTSEPVLYVERGGRGLVTLIEPPRRLPRAPPEAPLRAALAALAEAVRAGRVRQARARADRRRAGDRSALVELLVELGFHSGPRRLTLSA